jgi:hypothetical protein
VLVYPSMLIDAAMDAGMAFPPEVEEDLHFDIDSCKKEYPHFFVYCMIQLCRPITWGNHWNNAKIIANVPKDELMTMTEQDFVRLGFDP